TVPGLLDQRQEPVLDLRLPAAEQPDRVPGRHAGPQGLQGPPLPDHQVEAIGRDAHRTASSRTLSRTIAAYGFGRLRSRTSSATLNCRALYAGSPRVSSVTSSGGISTASRTPSSSSVASMSWRSTSYASRAAAFE